MKLEELYEGLLEEGLSQRVFHLTGGRSLYNILKHNVFILRSGGVFEMGSSSGKYFFMSTARSKTSSFMRDRLPPEDYVGGWNFKVVLHLDGRRLNANYRSTAVDYLRNEWGKGYSKIDSELEDRIISDKNHIPNAKRYIAMVEIMYPNVKTSQDTGQLKEVLRMLDSANIPWLVYENERDIINNNRKTGIDRKEFDSMVNDGDQFSNPYDEGDYNQVVRGDETSINAINAIISLYNVKVLRRPDPNVDKNNLKQHYKKWLNDIEDYGVALVPSKLDRDISIASQLKFILIRMRRDGFSSLEKYVTHLVKMETS